MISFRLQKYSKYLIYANFSLKKISKKCKFFDSFLHDHFDLFDHLVNMVNLVKRFFAWRY